MLYQSIIAHSYVQEYIDRSSFFGWLSLHINPNHKRGGLYAETFIGNPDSPRNGGPGGNSAGR
jgi:hypothetical protein